MEFRVLYYFLTVAREGNITRAASVLHMTQPTLSRQLAQLEEELGAPLLVRRRHCVSLTKEGRMLLRRAEEITDLVPIRGRKLPMLMIAWMDASLWAVEFCHRAICWLT